MFNNILNAFIINITILVYLRILLEIITSQKKFYTVFSRKLFE